MLRRLSHWINNFNPYFLAALRCNHDMWGSDTHIMTVIVYMTNYMTKIQRRLLSTVMLVQVSWFLLRVVFVALPSVVSASHSFRVDGMG